MMCCEGGGFPAVPVLQRRGHPRGSHRAHGHAEPLRGLRERLQRRQNCREQVGGEEKLLLSSVLCRADGILIISLEADRIKQE
jgi:hypothetical protein